MSFNKSFNNNNKFILGSTKLKSAPSTGGPTLSLNNENNLIISSPTLPTITAEFPETSNNNNNNNNNIDHNDDLISLLENINHSSVKNSGDDKLIKNLMKQEDEAEDSSSSSSEEEVSEEKMPEKEEEEEANEKRDSLMTPSLPHESSSQTITVPVDVTKDEVIKPSSKMDIKTESHKDIIPHNEEKQEQEEEQIPFDFQQFLKQLKAPECEPIIRYMKSFMKQFNMRNWSIEEQAKLIKDFEKFIFDKYLEIEQLQKKITKNGDLINLREGFEKLIMSRLYTQVFPPLLVNTNKLTQSHKDELIQDMKLLENLIKFQWIENRHLDIPDSIMENSQSFLKLSTNELNKLNNYKSPRDKIICILNCCKVIFGLIRKNKRNSKLEENADTFVPLLIYIILKGKPKYLHSNLQYIESFRQEIFLNGESLYYLSSLQLLANFIIKLDIELLSIEEEEYNSNISKVELDLKLKKQEKERKISPTPLQLIAGKLSDDVLSPSQILATSANVLQQKFTQFFSAEDEEQEQQQQEPDKKVLSKIKKLSLKEHQEQIDSTRKLQEVFENLKSIFPNIEDDILKDIIVLKNYQIGDCIDSCLELAN